MRILHVIWDSSIGGLEKYVQQLTLCQIKNNNHVEVCVLHKLGVIGEQLLKKGVNVHLIRLENSFDILAGKRLYDFVNSNSFDILHVHDRNILANIIICFFSKTPKFFTEHGGELIGNVFSKRIKRHLFYKIFSFKFNKIIANSNHVKNNLLQNKLVNAKKVVTIFNGLYLDDFQRPVDSNMIYLKNQLGIERDNKIVGIIARIVYLKGIDLFIQVADRLLKINNKITFLIIGDGPLRKDYESLVKESVYCSKIKFLGWKEDVSSYLSIFDIFLFTSRWESFGLVLLEAMAAGIPIVGFNIPGANEVVKNNTTGLLVAPYNVDSLVNAVLSVLQNRSQHADFSRNGLALVKEKFSINMNSLEISKLYSTT